MGAARRSHRVVAIGDLNGAFDALREILQGVDLIDERDRWVGGSAHLIQIGDIFNRGGGARDAFKLLMRLERQAVEVGGRVTVLLGNHEVMTALGVESYCTAEEYLSFATRRQRRDWEQRRQREFLRLHREHPAGGPVLPVSPRLEAWKLRTVPGQDALRRAMGSRGSIGRQLRRLPIAAVDGGCVFSHAALTPSWARLGVDGLNAAAREAWRDAPRFYRDFPQHSILADHNGPLWNRTVTLRDNARTRHQLARSLEYLGGERMVVGHTITGSIPGGEPGRIALRHDGKLVCIDVGLGHMGPLGRAALVIDNGRGTEWTPHGTRELWRKPSRARRQRAKSSKRRGEPRRRRAASR